MTYLDKHGTEIREGDIAADSFGNRLGVHGDRWHAMTQVFAGGLTRESAPRQALCESGTPNGTSCAATTMTFSTWICVAIRHRRPRR